MCAHTHCGTQVNLEILPSDLISILMEFNQTKSVWFRIERKEIKMQTTYRLIGHRLSTVHRSVLSSLNAQNRFFSSSSDTVTADSSLSSSSPTSSSSPLSKDHPDKPSKNSSAKSFDSFIKHVQAVKQSLAHESSPPKPSAKQEPPEDSQSFATLLRSSRLMQWGDFNQGIVTTGKVVHVMGDDLYIDFGGKFQCVCRRPTKQAKRYVRNAKVKRLKAIVEMSWFIDSLTMVN